MLHHDWPTRRRQSGPVTAILERLAKQAGKNKAIGFDIAGTPLNRLRDPEVVYWRSIRDATLTDFANSYVFRQSLDKLHNAIWIPGFINKKELRHRSRHRDQDEMGRERYRHECRPVG